MIVDLIRNDMGRVAELGTIQVLNFPRLESLTYFHHLVGDIQCQIRNEVTFLEILRALFPCGSITGAPKISAMSKISYLEKDTRGIYTGAIGIIRSRRDFTFNVAIRSPIVKDERYIFQTGGGVVIDSDPECEYRESLDKARMIYSAWKITNDNC